MPLFRNLCFTTKSPSEVLMFTVDIPVLLPILLGSCDKLEPEVRLLPILLLLSLNIVTLAVKFFKLLPVFRSFTINLSSVELPTIGTAGK